MFFFVARLFWWSDALWDHNMKSWWIHVWSVSIALAQKHVIQNTTWEYSFLHCLDHTSQNDISTYFNSTAATTTTTTTQVNRWKPASNAFERCFCSHDWVKRFSFARIPAQRRWPYERWILKPKTGKKWHHCHHTVGDTKTMSTKQPTTLS